MYVHVCGCAHVWVFGFGGGWWVCGCVGVWVCGYESNVNVNVNVNVTVCVQRSFSVTPIQLPP